MWPRLCGVRCGWDCSRLGGCSLLGAAVALMQRRTAATFTFTAGSAETIGEIHTGLGRRDCINPEFASALASLGEFQSFLQHRIFLCPQTRSEFFPFPPPLPWLHGDCGSFNEQSWLMPTNPDLANNLCTPACNINDSPWLQCSGRVLI